MTLKGLEEYMLPCTNKTIFGIECLGCGIQRATVLVFRGEFLAAFKMYPAIYTLMLLLAFVGFNLFVKFKYDFQIKLALLFLNVIIIIVSYFYKMSQFM
ncbi:DUF2752 domain-containing protein [Altibacter sp. HG106]|uniref:DUF2752 domain-containing protein n=1 Tax=Altibacter sp. HG106 TaxID=3023937 RepID=UPI002350DC01|nr:DUF2752 domain-containing protein [Altibacter sp. HG106]MDC7996175.1 DUF2752 domain-containing protein [Altibacter sp. HG106]